jgi:hypothetical protein
MDDSFDRACGLRYESHSSGHAGEAFPVDNAEPLNPGIAILHHRGLRIFASCGAYDTAIAASEDRLVQVLSSVNEGSAI